MLLVRFVTGSWKVNATGANGAKRRRAEGCLGDACCRLLAALVLTTTMHPGTLIADLGADPMSDSPMVSYVSMIIIFCFFLGLVVRCCRDVSSVSPCIREAERADPTIMGNGQCSTVLCFPLRTTNL